MRSRSALVLWLFVLSISLMVRLSAQTPTPPAMIAPLQLVGLWVLTSDATLAGKKVEAPVHRVRGFTVKDWYYAQSSPTKNTVDFLFGGTYTVGSRFRQIVSYSSVGAEEMLTSSEVFQIKLEGDTLTITGRHRMTGSSSTDTTEVWRRLEAPGLSSAEQARLPQESELNEIALVQRTISAESQNLAASYLNNHGRLAMIAMIQKGDLKNVNLFVGNEKITQENAAKSAIEFQHREDVYGAEMKHRGTTQIAGSYRVAAGSPCSDPPMDVELKQDGFTIEIRKPGTPGEHILSGAVVAGILTIGDGDFNPDNYAFGKIGADGTIDLKAFSGQGCAMTLTRR